ncbi:MAG: hypothetical protein IKY71_04745 [Bacteroidaceae bacterium]|nr:hypothetical protein [Bacteroidaceae bacterium]
MEQTKKQFRYRGANSTGSAWHYANSPDDLKTAGHYTVCLSHDDLMSIGVDTDYCSKEHTIVAQLFVTESAIADKQQQGRVVGQTLVLAACDGATVEILSRTAEKQAHGFVWQPWSRMSQNIELGEVTSLDDYTESGTYKGVFTNGNNKYETFIMVIINNAPVAQTTGKVRCISQFKYALGTDSNFSYKTRTGRGDDDIEWGDWVDLGAATTSDIQDCAITAQKLSTDVREKVDNPLRPLFIAAGAEYNDTGTDKTKTAPWGETVTHKAGHYYLNGLGDITEEQMMDIYKYSFPMLGATDWSNAFREVNVRTNLFYKQYYSAARIKTLTAAFNANKTIEIVDFNNRGSKVVLHDAASWNYAFGSCTKLKRILGVLDINNASSLLGSNCDSLIHVQLYNLNTNLLLFNKSNNIDKESVLYAIQNSTPTSAITITLHPDAYSRLADDAEIVAALEAQPLISLVSA